MNQDKVNDLADRLHKLNAELHGTSSLSALTLSRIVTAYIERHATSVRPYKPEPKEPKASVQKPRLEIVK